MLKLIFRVIIWQADDAQISCRIYNDDLKIGTSISIFRIQDGQTEIERYLVRAGCIDGGKFYPSVAGQTHFELDSLELSIHRPEFEAINGLLVASKSPVFAITFPDGVCSIKEVPDRMDRANHYKRLVFTNLDKSGYDMLQRFECVEV